MSNMTKHQKDLILVVLSSIIFVSIAAYSYFSLFAPSNEEHMKAKQNVDYEREVLLSLRTIAEKEEETANDGTDSLQKRVPVLPLEDEVLLQLLEAEKKSNGLIKDIQFSAGEFPIESAPEHVKNISRLSGTVGIEVNSYKDLESFIFELEQMDRIALVDSITFNWPDDSKHPITLGLTFSTFFRPDLKGLLGEVPKVETKPSANKNNPFPTIKKTDEGDK